MSPIIAITHSPTCYPPHQTAILPILPISSRPCASLSFAPRVGKPPSSPKRIRTNRPSGKKASPFGYRDPLITCKYTTAVLLVSLYMRMRGERGITVNPSPPLHGPAKLRFHPSTPTGEFTSVRVYTLENKSIAIFHFVYLFPHLTSAYHYNENYSFHGEFLHLGIWLLQLKKLERRRECSSRSMWYVQNWKSMVITYAWKSQTHLEIKMKNT